MPLFPAPPDSLGSPQPLRPWEGKDAHGQGKAGCTGLFTLVDGAALALGSFLARDTALGIGATGMGGGDDALIGGLLVAAVGFAAYSGRFSLPKWIGWAGLVIGLGVAIINLLDMMDVDGGSVGLGMWLMLAGGVVAFYGMLQKSSRSIETNPDRPAWCGPLSRLLPGWRLVPWSDLLL